jgi:hypothetical protein
VTGHSNLRNPETARFVSESFHTILVALSNLHGPRLVALSGLAVGADTLFAEAARQHGIPLECCLASDDILESFAPGPDRDRYLDLRRYSSRVHQLPFAERSNTAYMALGRWLVDSCDVLVAAWSGLPAAAEGGTGDVAAYARAVGRRGVHIHTLQRTFRLL